MGLPYVFSSELRLLVDADVGLSENEVSQVSHSTARGTSFSDSFSQPTLEDSSIFCQ